MNAYQAELGQFHASEYARMLRLSELGAEAPAQCDLRAGGGSRIINNCKRITYSFEFDKTGMIGVNLKASRGGGGGSAESSETSAIYGFLFVPPARVRGLDVGSSQGTHSSSAAVAATTSNTSGRGSSAPDLARAYCCLGATFRSQDGEYRRRFKRLSDVLALAARYEREFGLVEAMYLDELTDGRLHLSSDLFYPQNFTGDRAAFEEKLSTQRIGLTLLVACWLADFHRIHLSLMENHIHPAYQLLIYDKAQLPVYRKCWVAAGEDQDATLGDAGPAQLDAAGAPRDIRTVAPRDIRTVAPRDIRTGAKANPRLNALIEEIDCCNDESQGLPPAVSPIQTGQKILTMTVNSVSSIHDIHFAVWRELYVASECASLILNLVSPSFPFVNSWFFVQHAHPGLYDNWSQFVKFEQSEIAQGLVAELRQTNLRNFINGVPAASGPRPQQPLPMPDEDLAAAVTGSGSASFTGSGSASFTGSGSASFTGSGFVNFTGSTATAAGGRGPGLEKNNARAGQGPRLIPINDLFERLSNKIKTCIEYAESNIVLADIAILIHTEHVGRTLRDNPPLVQRWLAINPEFVDRSLFSPVFFPKHLFEFAFALLSMNSRLKMTHGDLHLNNATIFKLFDTAQLERLFAPSGKPKIAYVLGPQRAYVFEHIGLFSMLIDFSRAIIGDFGKLKRDFGIDFADQYFKHQNYRILHMLYQYFPNYTTKNKNKLLAAMLTNFDAFFRVITVVDMFVLARNLSSMFELEAKRMPIPREVVDLTARVAACAEELLLTGLSGIIASAAGSGAAGPAPAGEWPLQTLIETVFAPWARTGPQPLAGVEGLVDCYRLDNPLDYSAAEYDRFPPMLQLHQEIALKKKHSLSWADEVRNEVFHLGDRYEKIAQLVDSYERAEQPVNSSSWM